MDKHKVLLIEEHDKWPTSVREFNKIENTFYIIIDFIWIGGDDACLVPSRWNIYSDNIIASDSWLWEEDSFWWQ